MFTIKFLVVVKCTCSFQEIFSNELNRLKVKIVFKTKTDQVGPQWWRRLNSVNVLILADEKVTIEDISEQLEISVGTVHQTAHDDLACSKVSCCWVPKMLMPKHKTSYSSKNSWKPLVKLVGNSYNILLIIHIWIPLVSSCLASINEFLRATKFLSDDEVKSTVCKSLKTQPKNSILKK